MTTTPKALDASMPSVVNPALDKMNAGMLTIHRGVDLETVKKVRRWLRGAAMLLAEAANGDPAIEHIAREVSDAATMTEAAILDLV
jgi:hypothetical protein